MAEVGVATGLSAGLSRLMDDNANIEPGSEAGYQLCKDIYLFHVLGAKIAEAPFAMAQSQEREISVPLSPGERVVDEFKKKWREVKADAHIFNACVLGRVYGASVLAMRARDIEPSEPIELFDLPKHDIQFVEFDPLNISGSLANNQNVCDFDFMQPGDITAGGELYHRSRTRVFLNEQPVYIAYTSSAYGYTGRSAYQRIVYPLKSFIQSMITDDMVTQKAGLLIAAIKMASSILDNIQQIAGGIKRAMLKGGRTGQVLQIAPGETIETLNMMNVDGAAGFARTNILKNCATGCDMPASVLNQDTMAEGFGEGTEDAKNIARWVDRVRVQMGDLYEFMDERVMYLAWTPEFFETMKAEFPEQYRGKSYKKIFFEWKNSFKAQWPSLLIEPESELVKLDEVRGKLALAATEVFLGAGVDPDSKATILGWLADTLAENKFLFQNPLVLDLEAIANYEPPQAQEGLQPVEPSAKTAKQYS